MTRVFGYLMSALLWLPLCVRGEIAVTDDAGLLVRLPAPAQRIVSLAPHITELAFAAGAGGKLVGAMQGSDYPVEASRLPRVGSASALDLEAIANLKPDLVLAWKSGNRPGEIERLRALGLPVFFSEPAKLRDVATNIERIGQLAGTQVMATNAARNYRERVRALNERFSDAPPVRVFYQIWHDPLMTVSDAHIISDGLRLCGGVNAFGGLAMLTPTVSRESVIAANPEVIASARGRLNNHAFDWREDWRKWRVLTASARGNFCEVNADLMSRAGPRLIEGAEALCGCIEAARKKRPTSAPPARLH